MKIYVKIGLILLSSVLGFSSLVNAQKFEDRIENVESVELKKANGGRIGAVIAIEGDPSPLHLSTLIVNCREKDEIRDNQSYVCAEIPVITKFSSLGLTLTLDILGVSLGSGFGFKNYNGKTLKDILGTYYGIQAGVALVVVGARTTPLMLNRNKVMAHNLLEVNSFVAEADLSGVRMKILIPEDSIHDHDNLLNKVLKSN